MRDGTGVEGLRRSMLTAYAHVHVWWHARWCGMILVAVILVCGSWLWSVVLTILDLDTNGNATVSEPYSRLSAVVGELLSALAVL